MWAAGHLLSRVACLLRTLLLREAPRISTRSWTAAGVMLRERRSPAAGGGRPNRLVFVRHIAPYGHGRLHILRPCFNIVHNCSPEDWLRNNIPVLVLRLLPLVPRVGSVGASVIASRERSPRFTDLLRGSQLSRKVAWQSWACDKLGMIKSYQGLSDNPSAPGSLGRPRRL